MGWLARVPTGRRDHVEARLRGNLMAWLTTVRPDGRPRTVPVWFLLTDDETILLFSQPGKAKLRNIEANPHVTLALDVCDLGRDVITVDGLAQRVANHPTALEVPQYLAKYAERIGALYGTPENFAESFSEAVVVTPSAIHT
ncbi:MAG TPA: pyridoxamine 5'-phosphate oxidase family protein [Streptosporangiales bacterium]